jgi:FAD/FMN-containing dehydrogenase
MAATPSDIPMDDLRAQLEGELLEPGHSGYDEAREVFFKGIDRSPLAVARVADAGDVARVVTAARESGIDLAVRSGGHSRAGYGTTEGGLVIDLSAMNALEIDTDAMTASVQTGMKAGPYTAATGERGLATGLGDTGSVGIGGITLAGGIGYFVRKNGLAIDDLLGAEVVTADGEIREVSADSEPDLFWAIRGGASNFGVATRLTLRVHEISEIAGGFLILPATPDVITGFLEAAEAAPEELSAIANVMIAPPMPMIPEEARGTPILMASMAYAGAVDQADEVFAPFRALADPHADMLGPMRYTELFQGGGPDAQLGSGANFFADSLEPAGAEAILEHLPRSTAMMKAVQLRVLGGAFGRVASDATAFAHRDRRLFVNIACMYADGTEKETHDAWAGGIADALGRGDNGGYVGFLGEENESTVQAAYGGNWDRLRELKRRYDPENLFRLNHNITPA